MVAPVSSPLSAADILATYQSVVRRAIDVFTAIIALYEPDIHSERDWADITVSQATTQREGLQQRLFSTSIKEAHALTLMGTLGHYLDAHWADYERLMPDPAKRQQVEQLHAQLKALMDETIPIIKILRQQERG
ncbi:MAG: hypothetical protein EOO62_14330 [Hymenobacter sp.]|nr:MAG: hypothetical protein EOO62_14330 [Hymenobacter sp.]